MITAVHYHGAHPHGLQFRVASREWDESDKHTRQRVLYRHGRRVFFFPPHLWATRLHTSVHGYVTISTRTTAFDVSISTHVPLLGNFFSFLWNLGPAYRKLQLGRMTLLFFPFLALLVDVDGC